MERRATMQLNPQLELLREKILLENSSQSNDWILRLIDRTSYIHAGYLFEDLKTLQDLCLFIAETQNKITDPGWLTLGYHLGLSPSVLKVINHNNFNKEDPCYNLFLAYVQYDTASIGKILEALFRMGRIDVLSRIQNSINDLADIILQYNGNNNNCIEETSDYESLTTNEVVNTTLLWGIQRKYLQNIKSVVGSSESDRSRNDSRDLSSSLIKPRIIPPAPFIFQNIKAVPEITSEQIRRNANQTISNSFSKDKCIFQNLSHTVPDVLPENFEKKILFESVQNQNCVNNKENQGMVTKKNYGLKILLTFAEDGRKYAEEVCRVFRIKRDNYPRIGVLVLSEHAGKVNKDPLQFICGAFAQVDYVCPILTEGYFNLVNKKQKVTAVSNMYLDSLYVPYIYRLMNSYFVSNDCLNDKVRCVIPDSELSLIPLNYLWANPIFGAWVKMSEVAELALRLLKSNSVNKA